MPTEGIPGGAPDGGSEDLLSILGTTPAESAEPGATAGGESDGQGGDGSGKAFTFGGRSYPSQSAAEKAHNALYGKFSDQQGILNKLKEAMKDPETLQALSEDPRWADILAKLGIENAGEDVRREVASDPDSDFDWESVPPPMRAAYEELQIERTVSVIDREERNFERKLGRALTDDEHDRVMDIIGKSGSLTFQEAFTLAFHERMLKDAVAKAQAGARPRPPSAARLSPLASMLPSAKVDSKKKIEEMSSAEWRENLRNSEELKQLLS